jgi:hypothetical protein
MATKKVAQINEDNYFMGMIECDRDPLEKNAWLIPGGCIEAPEPVFSGGNDRARWNGSGWDYDVDPLGENAPPAKFGYGIMRTKEYPAVGEQLDDLFKAGLFSEEMTARIQAVKDKYSKEEYPPQEGEILGR